MPRNDSPGVARDGLRERHRRRAGRDAATMRADVDLDQDRRARRPPRSRRRRCAGTAPASSASTPTVACLASAARRASFVAPTISLVTSTSRTPAATKASASPTFWQQMPTAPRSICASAMSGHLCDFACGRSATAGAAHGVAPSDRGCARTHRGRRRAPACRCRRRSRRQRAGGALHRGIVTRGRPVPQSTGRAAARRGAYFGAAASSAASWP